MTHKQAIQEKHNYMLRLEKNKLYWIRQARKAMQRGLTKAVKYCNERKEMINQIITINNRTSEII